MKLIKHSFFLLIITSIISCHPGSPEEKDNIYFSQIIKTDKGIIRGVNLNDEITHIKKKESKRAIVTETNTILEYEYKLKDKGTYVVTYQFDQQGCYEIDVDIYLSSPDFINDAQKTLNSFFRDKYGSPTQGDSLLVWKNKQKTMTIELDYLNKSEGEMMLTIFANE
ncbi:MAG: hypothetical protein J5I47_04310 [Vicingus serpentipes]|nr:hypothetical protein [Vicingus serpentipes]